MATTVDTSRETVSLIGSDKVDGTAVYGADERKIGSVQRVMIDKISGKVAYAVVSFGGFLGMGEDYYPMPWPNLQIRHAAGRLPRRRDRGSTQRGAEIQPEHRLGLVRSRPGSQRLRLLQDAALVLTYFDRGFGAPAGAFVFLGDGRGFDLGQDTLRRCEALSTACSNQLLTVRNLVVYWTFDPFFCFRSRQISS